MEITKLGLDKIAQDISILKVAYWFPWDYQRLKTLGIMLQENKTFNIDLVIFTYLNA